MIVAALLFSTACGDLLNDLVGGEATAEEVETAVEDLASEVKSDMVSLMNSEGVEAGMDAITNLFYLIDGTEEFKTISARDLKNPVDAKRIKEGVQHMARFVVPTKSTSKKVLRAEEDFLPTGIYEWNFSTEDFDLIDETVDYLELRFPTEGSNSNNAVMTISDFDYIEYEDCYYDEWDGTTYCYTDIMPTSLKASLKVNDEEMISIDFTGTWNGDFEPKTLNLSVFVKPFTNSLNFNLGTSVANFKTTLKNGDKTITENDVNIKYTGDLFEDGEVTEINGFSRILEIKVEGTINAKGITDAPENADLNEFINLTVFKDNKEFGKLKYEESGEDVLVYIELKNGEKVYINDIIEQLIEDLEVEFENSIFADFAEDN